MAEGGFNTPVFAQLATATAQRGPVNVMEGLSQGIAGGAAALAQGYFHKRELDLQEKQYNAQGALLDAQTKALAQKPYLDMRDHYAVMAQNYADKGGDVPDWITQKLDWYGGVIQGTVDPQKNPEPVAGKLPGVPQHEAIGAELTFATKGGRISNIPFTDEDGNELAGQFSIGDKHFLMPPEAVDTGQTVALHKVEADPNGNMIGYYSDGRARPYLKPDGTPYKAPESSKDTITLGGQILKRVPGSPSTYAPVDVLEQTPEATLTPQPNKLTRWYGGSRAPLSQEDFINGVRNGTLDAPTLARSRQLIHANPNLSYPELLRILNIERGNAAP